jgi:hypothetical protein
VNTGDDLSKAARTTLLAYKAERTPSDVASEQALANVQQRLLSGQTEIDWDTPDAPVAGGGTASGGLGKWLALGGLAVVIGTGALLLQPKPHASVPTQASVPHEVASKILPSEARESVVALLPSSEAEAPQRVEAQKVTLPTAKPLARTTGSAAPGAENPATSTLREEMMLLSRGQSAFNSGDYNGALRAFDEHRARFHSGALASERELKRIATLCRMGKKDEARAVADRYASQRSGSPSAEKAQRICAEAP